MARSKHQRSHKLRNEETTNTLRGIKTFCISMARSGEREVDEETTNTLRGIKT